MEIRIIVKPAFEKHVLSIHKYLNREFSAKTAAQFLDRLEKRIDLIKKHPFIGKPSLKRKGVRSITLNPHNRIYYHISETEIILLAVFDMRQNPGKIPF